MPFPILNLFKNAKCCKFMMRGNGTEEQDEEHRKIQKLENEKKNELRDSLLAPE